MTASYRAWLHASTAAQRAASMAPPAVSFDLQALRKWQLVCMQIQAPRIPLRNLFWSKVPCKPGTIWECTAGPAGLVEPHIEVLEKLFIQAAPTPLVKKGGGKAGAAGFAFQQSRQMNGRPHTALIGSMTCCRLAIT